MKTLSFVLLSALALNLLANVQDPTAKLLGTFVEPTQTFVVSYQEASDCTTDGGDWDAEMEMCFFDAANTAKVSATADGLYLTVDTVGSNAHQCYFEGAVTKTTATTVVSEVEAMVWNGTDFEAGTCEVTVTFENDDTVNVSNNGKCQEFCGARAWLSFGPATRQ